MRDAELRTHAEIVELALRQKPELIIEAGDLPSTVEALRELLADSDRLFDRGVPVRIVFPANSNLPVAIPLTKNNVVMEAHRKCQPMRFDRGGKLVAATLPDRVAQMYLDLFGEWSLRPLAGISTAPLLSDDGSVRSTDGYDLNSTLWCWRVPQLPLPFRPSRDDAEAAVHLLRHTFRTFPFGDSKRKSDAALGLEVVDTSTTPGTGRKLVPCRPADSLLPPKPLARPCISCLRAIDFRSR